MLTTMAQYLQISPWEAGPVAVFWAALVLIAGALLREIVSRRPGVPRIVAPAVRTLERHGVMRKALRRRRDRRRAP